MPILSSLQEKKISPNRKATRYSPLATCHSHSSFLPLVVKRAQRNKQRYCIVTDSLP